MNMNDEYRDSPEWQKWAQENRRRSEAMADAVHPIQGHNVDEEETEDDGTALPDSA
jgi:hypothetical protein